MYVIFNQDGSIKETQLGKYVNQHSKGVDFVDVAIDGRTNEDYACDANFALPNDANVTETSQINNKIVTSSGTYGGYRIGFNEAETEYDGDLSCSIRVYNKDGSVLWTFPFSIVVNKTTGYGDENITNDQYESLVRSMANYQLMFSKTNVRSYETLDEANNDLASMAEGQLVFIKNGDARDVYAKKGDSFEMQSIQKKTFLHILTAKGATLSMSFTYPSTNQLPVDSAQDAAAVIKPTANEYFASPVVVVATKKISDGYNCIHYDGTSWKFALWDGTSFTDGEAVTAWVDSVVNVD